MAQISGSLAGCTMLRRIASQAGNARYSRRPDLIQSEIRRYRSLAMMRTAVQLKDLPHVSDVRENAEGRRRGGPSTSTLGSSSFLGADSVLGVGTAGPGTGANARPPMGQARVSRAVAFSPTGGPVDSFSHWPDEVDGPKLSSFASDRTMAALRGASAEKSTETEQLPVRGTPSRSWGEVEAPLTPTYPEAARQVVSGLPAPQVSAFSPIPDGPKFQAADPALVEPKRYPNTPPADVCIVRDAVEARLVASQLLSLPSDEDRVFACDTEVADIDVTSQSPCCHGAVTCLSIYAGPKHHFGSAPRAVTADDGGPAPARSIIWVDTLLDGSAESVDEARAIFEAFVPFLTSRSHLKVWHNYGFDRHVLQRIPAISRAGDCAGFGGDTMHMARLWDAARAGRGYSLESLTGDAALMGDAAVPKRGMRSEFARPRTLKNGGESKVLELPTVRSLQTGEDTRWRWVRYSATDARATWDLYGALQRRLRAIDDVELDEAVAAALATDPMREEELPPGGEAVQDGAPAPPRPPIQTMWDVYARFWRPFGELLTRMEDAGMPVDRAHLAASQRRAEEDRKRSQTEFREWASVRVPDAARMNVGSGAQVLQLLFAGARCGKGRGERVPFSRSFKIPNPELDAPLEEGQKKPKKFVDISLHGLWGESVPSPLVPETFTPAGQPCCNTAVLIGLAGKPGAARATLEAMPPAPCEVDTPRTVAALKKLGASRGYGALFPHFGTEREGLRACAALGALVEASAIETLLSSFIVPLQSDDISRPVDEAEDGEWAELLAPSTLPANDAASCTLTSPVAIEGSNEAARQESVAGNVQSSAQVLAPARRVHCSMNINTETGRLSARCPNLQNQPALEKDRYRVRQAFATAPGSGRTLVVADYGQLELRVLAHVARCESMLAAFKAGGDFHSRTALGMYPEVAAAVARGECVLEWDGPGPPPAPLIKDKFSGERRRAKVLNFSIAYGKTEHGLSRDWGVSLEEAKATVDLWYAARPEVREWQRAQRDSASTKGYVTTILGRRRPLPDARGSAGGAARAHALRAAINSPIQGSAADIATAAMLRISRDEGLAELDWRLLLQVHDEVILEGPKETAEEARARVLDCMQHPFSSSPNAPPLLVDLVVDSKIADSWFDAK